MAGYGSRFLEKYDKPKPLIDVNGKRMVEVVIDDVTPSNYHQLVLVSLKKHDINHELKDLDRRIKVVEIEDVTRGTIETILKGEEHIQDGPLIIANCDQKINFNVDDFVKSCEDFDGGLVTFEANSEHHSYVQTDGEVITNVIEKEVVSNQAVSGVYYFKDAKEFIHAAKSIIKFNKKTNGEFYVSSALQLLIYKGLKLRTYKAESIMIGTPEELEKYLKTL